MKNISHIHNLPIIKISEKKGKVIKLDATRLTKKGNWKILISKESIRYKEAGSKWSIFYLGVLPRKDKGTILYLNWSKGEKEE